MASTMPVSEERREAGADEVMGASSQEKGGGTKPRPPVSRMPVQIVHHCQNCSSAALTRIVSGYVWPLPLWQRKRYGRTPDKPGPSEFSTSIV